MAITFLCMFITAGGWYYTFPLFYKPLQAEFSWSRGTISVAFTICMATGALLSPLIGRMVDRYGTRKIILLGAFVFGLGLLWLSLIQNLWSFYAAYLLIGLGMRAFGPVSTTKVVSNWFIKRRGLALGITASGFGVGGLVLAPAVGAYLIPNFGWRTSYLALALLTWVLIIPAGLLVIKERPSDIGLYPDGVEVAEATAKAKTTTQATEGFTLRMSLKTLTFWLIAIAFLASTSSNNGIIQHQINHLTDIGFPVAAAATALGAVGLCSGASKFIFGWLCDRMPAKYVAAISFVFSLAAAIVLTTLKSTSPLTMIWLYAILMGLGVGGWAAPQSMLISGNFGLASYGAIFGMITLITGTTSAFSPLVTGYIFDVTHSYFWCFVAFSILYATAIFSTLAVRRPKLRLPSSG